LDWADGLQSSLAIRANINVLAVVFFQQAVPNTGYDYIIFCLKWFKPGKLWSSGKNLSKVGKSQNLEYLDYQ
jgi:hypothetical protein